MAVPFGIAFLWVGYSVLYYGYNRITGGNDKFVDLIYPGRYHAVTRDDGSGSASAAPSKPAATKPKAKTTAKPRNLNALGEPLSSTRKVTPQ